MMPVILKRFVGPKLLKNRVWREIVDVSLVTEIMYQKRLTELSKIVRPIGPSDKILTRSDLNYFTSDTIFQ
jgi:hypothetical protein